MALSKVKDQQRLPLEQDKLCTVQAFPCIEEENLHKKFYCDACFRQSGPCAFIGFRRYGGMKLNRYVLICFKYWWTDG